MGRAESATLVRQFIISLTAPAQMFLFDLLRIELIEIPVSNNEEIGDNYINTRSPNNFIIIVFGKQSLNNVSQL